MPGKLGMSPVHSSFSVPVLMPLQSISTTTSACAGAFSARVIKASCCGLSNTMAWVWKAEIMVSL
jgi:hypothetical protein